ncbi:unnamed protein product [Caenorhabditis angaria]|uniref:5-hydroxyisourate hydrolase n=1 Tax=Caenorhabditis angaria TaxID=860376 RepID=A0A9P1IR33_9PELO|nr:unnamed protein product [Caenorhabditis angaria]
MLIFLILSIFSISMIETVQVPTASISAHVLDISGGSPAAGVQIIAYFLENDAWKEIGNQFTQDNGRVDWVCPNFDLVAGRYRIVYLTKAYYDSKGVDTFYPYIEVIFEVKNPTQHYHVPLTLSPWGYSTYRGS